MANLPTVSSPLPRDLQQFISRVREALDGGGEDAVVTARQLIAAGVVKNKNGGGFTTVNGPIEAPRAPSNLSASGALANIILSWNAPTYNGHAYTEIWAHTSNVIGDAVLVGMTAGNNFAHNLGDSATRYYWVRNINQNGTASAFNATDGTQATTGTSPTYLLSLLTDQITSSQLATTLSTRIDLVDGADTVSGSVNARIKIEADPLKAQYTVKIDSNGHVSGFGLGSEDVDGTLISNFMVAADRFSVVNPNVVNGAITMSVEGSSSTRRYVKVPETVWNAYTYVNGDTLIITGMGEHPTNGLNGTYTIFGKANVVSPGYGKVIEVGRIRQGGTSGFLPDLDAASGQTAEQRMAAAYPDARGAINLDQKAPFIISTGSTTINGVTVPAGVYMNSAMIGDATITNAKIGDAAIDSAKIANATIVAGDIADATITGAKIDSATITSANIASGTITSANIQDATIATADIANGAIDNAKIGNVIQSAAYSAGSAGWKIDKTGAMEMNNATFRGTIDVQGSAGSNRLNITSTKIQVIDSSNVVRVKLGDLS